ncbi:MAG: radical SAM/SPASM domain-containing protein [Candidatus Heimdallarchaeaceae archaeon]
MMQFNKFFRCDTYEIFFSTHTGLEIMQGRNGHEDPFSLHLPSLLDVGIMGHCKHKCRFCYQGHEDEPNMKLEDFKSIIDQVKHHTNQVALGGRGDPNHHENFKEIIEYAHLNGVVPNYTTSGIDLTDEHIEISKMCGAVAVSDYQQDYTYDALQRFMDAGIKTNIHLIFTYASYDEAIKILYGSDPWKGRVDIDKLNAVIFLLFKAAGAGKDFPWQPTKLQLKIFAELVFTPKSKFKIGMDSCLINHVLQYVEPDEVQRMSIDSCEGARMSAYITPDMKLMPCSFADKAKWAIPMTKKKDINYIWNRSNPFKSFRKILKNNQCCCPLGL